MALKIPPLLLAVILAVLMSVLARVSPQLSFKLPMNWAAAAILTCIGALICIVAVISFYRAQTTVAPHRPHQSSALVMTGLYRISRNPMYLGFLLLLVAWGIYLANVPALLLMPVIFIVYMNRFQIIPEEKALDQAYGDVFLAYRRKVRRWL